MVFSISWAAIPLFWKATKSAIHEADLRNIKNPCNLIPILSGIIAAVYLEGEQICAVCNRTLTKN